MQPARDAETGKKKQMRFQGVRTDTECCELALEIHWHSIIMLTHLITVIWISCAPPLDPVKLTYTIADDLQNGGPVRTRCVSVLDTLTTVSG